MKDSAQRRKHRFRAMFLSLFAALTLLCAAGMTQAQEPPTQGPLQGPKRPGPKPPPPPTGTTLVYEVPATEATTDEGYEFDASSIAFRVLILLLVRV